MRRIALFVLLASSAVPALAAFDDEPNRPQRDNPAAEQRERVERPDRAERNEARREAMQARREAFEARRSAEAQQAPPPEIRAQRVERQAVDTSQPSEEFQRRFHRRDRGYEGPSPVAGADGIVPRQRDIRTIPNTNDPAQQVGTRHRDRDWDRRDGRHAGNHRDWSRNWRHDHRYDWRRHRDRNRSRFSLGFYFDPFGYGYRRYNIGSYMYPSYYSSRYWLNDPWSYRLPPAWGPYRWVRYHNDAVLIDTWTGQVVDVIYGFFW